MSTPKMSAWPGLASTARRVRRSVTVDVDVRTTVDATVYLDDISTKDLQAELKERAGNPPGLEALGEGFSVFTLNTLELEYIRHLYMCGRDVEASDKCRRLLADMLGKAL
jgi:hypothetical protein